MKTIVFAPTAHVLHHYRIGSLFAFATSGHSENARFFVDHDDVVVFVNDFHLVVRILAFFAHATPSEAVACTEREVESRFSFAVDGNLAVSKERFDCATALVRPYFNHIFEELSIVLNCVVLVRD